MSLIVPGLPGTIGGRGAEYSAEAKALFARFTVKPTGVQKRAMDRLIRALKSSGAWAKLDVLYVMAAHDAQAAQRNWIADSFNLSPVNSPTFTAKQGYAGNGTTSYLDTGYAPGVSAGLASQNDVHLGVWVQSSYAAFEIDVGNTNCSVLAWSSGTAWSVRLMNASGGSLGSASSALGHSVVSRASSTTINGYRGGSSVGTVAATSAAPVSAPLYICGRNNAGALATPTSRRQAIVHAGAALTAGQVAAMQSAFSAYLAAIA